MPGQSIIVIRIDDLSIRVRYWDQWDSWWVACCSEQGKRRLIGY